jgi:aryl-alcohol dehydrogenase-like predicted oxidoreductase
MGMSGMYGPADRAESIATIHAALDAGITLLDTGDFYGMGHNELLIAEVVRDRPRKDYMLNVKVAIAWTMARGEDIVALVGARTRERLEEALGSQRLELDGGDLAALERAIPPDAAAGDRYPGPQMAMLDSER